MTVSELLSGVVSQSTIERWGQPLEDAAQKYSIDRDRILWWLANLLHEAGPSLDNLEENLNYTTPERLMAVWPSRFPTVQSAKPYVRAPQKLANFVYSNRMGNGIPASNDGYFFRGRGLIQLTGRSNYTKFQQDTGYGVVGKPHMLSEIPKVAAESAAWYWSVRNLNDAPNFEYVVKAINGGLNGLDDRLRWLRLLEENLNSVVKLGPIEKLVLHNISWADVQEIAAGIIMKRPIVLGDVVATFTRSNTGTKLDVRRLSK